MAEKKLKICFYSMNGVGHIAACVGVMQPLIARGHDVFFIITEEHAGKMEKFGARAHILKTPDMTPEEKEAQQNAAKEGGKKLLQSGLLSGKSSIEKMKCMNNIGFVEMLRDALIKDDPHMTQILDDEKPDLILFDHFFVPPCFVKSNIPWIMVQSPSPLFVLKDSRLPPAFSGYSMNEPDPELWKEFHDLNEKHFFGPIREMQKKLFQDTNVDFPEYDTNMIMSPYLNIYAYPKELGYESVVPTPNNCYRIDAFSREVPEDIISDDMKLPERFLKRDKDVALIYLSMGSMGGFDIDLMQRLISFITDSKHMFVVVKGTRGDEYEIKSDNIFAGNFLPQTAILPKCDLVITHGGNNSTTETFFAGKPMIVLPLFADQYDNGTRVKDCGFGVCFNPYTVTKEELNNAIEQILADDDMKQRLDLAVKRISKDDSKIKLAQKLEQIAAENCKK